MRLLTILSVFSNLVIMSIIFFNTTISSLWNQNTGLKKTTNLFWMIFYFPKVPR